MGFKSLFKKERKAGPELPPLRLHQMNPEDSLDFSYTDRPNLRQTPVKPPPYRPFRDEDRLDGACTTVPPCPCKCDKHWSSRHTSKDIRRKPVPPPLPPCPCHRGKHSSYRQQAAREAREIEPSRQAVSTATSSAASSRTSLLSSQRSTSPSSQSTEYGMYHINLPNPVSVRTSSSGRVVLEADRRTIKERMRDAQIATYEKMMDDHGLRQIY